MSVEGRSPEGGGQAALARLVRELAIPVPFDLDTFGSWLQRHREHKVHLAPVTMPSGAPSGVLLRLAGADYLYYEEQTSAFHQAHIVLCLAAHLVLGEVFRPSIDLRLAPDVCPQLVRMMLGEPAECTRRWDWAEAFAFLVLDQARPARPAVPARDDLRQLSTLHDALCSAVPDDDDSAVPPVGPAGRFRLHRQVIEIRDAMLVLRPYRDPRAASAAAAAGWAAGLAGNGLAAAAEAAVLADARQAKIAGQEARHASAGSSWLPAVGAGLAEEAAWLAQVSRALAPEV